MGLYLDLIGTLRSTLRIGNSTLDASALSALRNHVLPNISGTLALTSQLGGGGGTFGQATVDFGSDNAGSITVSVANAAVTSASVIALSLGGVPGWRDSDEMELADIQLSLGAITNAVGFDIIANSPDMTANGEYLVNYIRS